MFTTASKEKLFLFKTMKNEDGLYVLKTKIFNRIDDLNFLCPVLLDSNHDIIYMYGDQRNSRIHGPCGKADNYELHTRKILDYISSKNNKIGHIQICNLQETESEAYGKRSPSFTSRSRS